MAEPEPHPPAAPGPGPRLRMGRVVGKSSFAGTRVAVQASPGPPPAQAASGPVGSKRSLVVAAGFVAVAVLALILNFTLPWIQTEGNFSSDGGLFFGFGGDTLDREDLEDGAADFSQYIDDILDWPVLAFVALLILGPLMAVVEFVRLHAPVQRIVRRALMTMAGFMGFVVALTGMRWLGIYISELWHAGGADFHLHAAPYVNLAAGFTVLGGATYALWRDLAADKRPDVDPALRVAGLTALVAAAGLLLAPLLPYATATSDFDEETEYFSEFTFDLLRDIGSRQVEKPGEDLHLARLMLWMVLYGGVITSFVALIRREAGQGIVWTTLGQVYAALAFLHLTGIAFTALFYVHLPDLEEAITVGGFYTTDVAPFVNVALPISYLALAAVYVLYVRGVLMPFSKKLSQMTPRLGDQPAIQPPPLPPSFERKY